MANGPDVISVVAGGWSVNEVDLSLIPGFVIGVNDSAYRLPRVDAVVSMDRLWTENRTDWLLEKRPLTYLREGTVPTILQDRPFVTMYKCNHKTVAFGPTPIYMNGTNSAVVALNLAYIMWPKDLYLFGFDMRRGPQDQAHWHPDYPWNKKATKAGKLAAWGKEFSSIAEEFKRKKIAVHNVSSRSRIEVFKRYSPAELGFQKELAS